MSSENQDVHVLISASTTYSLSRVTQRKAGVLIYDVVAHDDQDDFITFSMTSDPVTDNFEIVTSESVAKAWFCFVLLLACYELHLSKCHLLCSPL